MFPYLWGIKIIAGDPIPTQMTPGAENVIPVQESKQWCWRCQCSTQFGKTPGFSVFFGGFFNWNHQPTNQTSMVFFLRCVSQIPPRQASEYQDAAAEFPGAKQAKLRADQRGSLRGFRRFAVPENENNKTRMEKKNWNWSFENFNQTWKQLVSFLFVTLGTSGVHNSTCFFLPGIAGIRPERKAETFCRKKNLHRRIPTVASQGYKTVYCNPTSICLACFSQSRHVRFSSGILLDMGNDKSNTDRQMYAGWVAILRSLKSKLQHLSKVNVNDHHLAESRYPKHSIFFVHQFSNDVFSVPMKRQAWPKGLDIEMESLTEQTWKNNLVSKHPILQV